MNSQFDYEEFIYRVQPTRSMNFLTYLMSKKVVTTLMVFLFLSLFIKIALFYKIIAGIVYMVWEYKRKKNMFFDVERLFFTSIERRLKIWPEGKDEVIL
jgi:hypothetical protein